MVRYYCTALGVLATSPYVAYDDAGNTVKEWSARIPAKDINHAELRALLEALRWAARQGLRQVKVYTDSQVAAFSVQSGSKDSKYGRVIRQIRGLVAVLNAIVIWIPRKLQKIPFAKYSLSKGRKRQGVEYP